VRERADVMVLLGEGNVYAKEWRDSGGGRNDYERLSDGDIVCGVSRAICNY
jgi:hypothetical protein